MSLIGDYGSGPMTTTTELKRVTDRFIDRLIDRFLTVLCSGSSDVQDVSTVRVQRREHAVLDGVRRTETRNSSGHYRRKSAIHL